MLSSVSIKAKTITGLINSNFYDNSLIIWVTFKIRQTKYYFKLNIKWVLDELFQYVAYLGRSVFNNFQSNLFFIYNEGNKRKAYVWLTVWFTNSAVKHGGNKTKLCFTATGRAQRVNAGTAYRPMS